jgi:hypothetical protein
VFARCDVAVDEALPLPAGEFFKGQQARIAQAAAAFTRCMKTLPYAMADGQQVGCRGAVREFVATQIARQPHAR